MVVISMTQIYVLLVVAIVALAWSHHRSEAKARQTEMLFDAIVLRSEQALGPKGFALVSKEYLEASFGHRRAEWRDSSTVVEAFLDNRDAELIISRYTANSPLRDQQPLARATTPWPTTVSAPEATKTLTAAADTIVQVATA
jgi:hypothetical protein